HFLLVSVDLPVAARVVEASPGRPYLGVRLALDPAGAGELLAAGMSAPGRPFLGVPTPPAPGVVGELLAAGMSPPPLGPPARGLAVTPVEPPLLDAVTRLVALLDPPRDIAPL